MAATDDLRSLIDRTNRDLDDWSDFAEPTKEVWRTFRLWVEAGNQLISQNQATGTTATAAALVSLSQFYLTENLAPLVLQRFISVFEAFVFDFLRILLLRNPGYLPTRPLVLAELLALRGNPNALEIIIEAAVDKKLNDLRYAAPTEWFEFVNKVEQFGCPLPDEIQAAAEIKATRDVVEHNTGIVNAIYLAKAGTKARFANGDLVVVSDDYLRNSWDLLKKICNDLAHAGIKVFSIRK